MMSTNQEIIGLYKDFMKAFYPSARYILRTIDTG